MSATTMHRNFRFAVGLLAALCIGMPVMSAKAQSPGGGAKPQDRIPPKADQALPNGNATAAPRTENGGHSGTNEHSGHAPKDKSESSPAKGADVPEIRMKDLGAVDTRITVPPQPHRADDRKQNPLPHSPRGLRLMPPRIHHPGRPTTRNSIGEAFPSSAQPAAHAPSQGISPAITNPAIAARSGEGPGSAVTMPGNTGPAPLHARPITGAPAASRSTIDGGNIVRPGGASVGIGGPAKSLVGINGSAIRPKH